MRIKKVSRSLLCAGVVTGFDLGANQSVGGFSVIWVFPSESGKDSDGFFVVAVLEKLLSARYGHLLRRAGVKGAPEQKNNCNDSEPSHALCGRPPAARPPPPVVYRALFPPSQAERGNGKNRGRRSRAALARGGARGGPP